MRGRASPGAPVAARRPKASSNSTAIFARMHLPTDQYKCFIGDIFDAARKFRMKIIEAPKPKNRNGDMNTDKALREHLVNLLQEGHAHAAFEAAVKNMPAAQRGQKPKGAE